VTQTVAVSLLDYFPDWWADALCKWASPDVFFGNDTSTGRLNEARVYCASCPVAGDCLRHALTVPERFGIWAGTSASSREAMIRDIGEVDVDDIVDYVLRHRFRWRRSE
jgi:WhiB family transcriptional regulator, redox-sensing transcriptional regulator